ncbi:hypothetical protein [Wolbachia endosymbiont (group A) of Anomoia purmunda]|uniref:hypothetical protein n=1 Tax=Wolbachia endosymbiont (group A) of Anomoia purmunda TaxID=2953978 RepID=UPI002230CEA4|nr:hypothetical protein [Wolbachia endosymbiont (group A) of Anomoia purmunda]
MPKKMERHVTVLNKLKSVIQHTDSKVMAERRSAIERWVKTYIRQVEYLKDDKLQFLYNIFRDESCWSGTRLNNTILGQRFTEEKIGEIKNPLPRYDMACRYCVIDKIPLLFQEQFESYKSSFSSEEIDDDGKPATSNNKYVKSELLGYMKSQDPVFSFWVDKKSGEFKRHVSATEGFKKAIALKWSEGVEYFYSLLNEREREITDAVTILSSVQCDHNGAVTLDFCLSKMSDQAKNKLFKDSELSKKDKVVYSLFSALIHQGFFDAMQAILPMFKDKILEDKILSPRSYTLLLSSLSDMMLENSELTLQAREAIMNLIKCGNFNNHEGREEKAAVFFSNGRVPIKRALAGLIVDWQLGCTKKEEVLKVLQFAKEFCAVESFMYFKKSVVDNLKMVGREGMRKNTDYGKLAEKLFAELDKTLPSGRGDVGGAGNPYSLLEAPGVSGLPVRSK